ncbi:MAG: ATP-binding protein [Candidatus Helarchaeota archaeon]
MKIEKLYELNPWWAHKEVSVKLTGKPRKEYAFLLKSTSIDEISIITGVRRSGKSTLMYQMVDRLLKDDISAEQILFLNLEDTKIAHDTLEEIYKTYRISINPDKKAYIFLDEIHRREKWEYWIRNLYDKHHDCKFIVSGSCSYLLKKEYSTLLTGRNLTFEVFPLNFREFLSFKGINIEAERIILDAEKYTILNNLEEFLEYGGFPAIFFRDKEFKKRILSQYFDDILYKDIIDRYNLNSQKAKDLALYLITNFTSLISLRSLRNSLGLSYETIKHYISYFKEAFLFFTIDHFSYSMKVQKTHPSKVYCIDNGLRNAVSFKFSADEGKLVENLVFLELRRRGKDVYYWKSKKQKEVDFIIKNINQSLTAMNVTYTDEINEREINSLIEFKDNFDKTNELIVITKDTEKTIDQINFIPLWRWLLNYKEE